MGFELEDKVHDVDEEEDDRAAVRQDKDVVLCVCFRVFFQGGV